MIYLTMHQALRIHDAMIAEFGGASGIRDPGLLESALLRPQTGYYSDLIEEAAALWESLAMIHPFVDGNKRVAYGCLELFLNLNGLDVTATNEDAERFIYGSLESGTFRKDAIDAWLRVNTGPLPPEAVSE